MRICDVSSGCNWDYWSWGDGINLGDHSWDASGDVAGCQGDGHGDWVRWVCWYSNIGGGGDGSRGVGIDWVGGGVYRGAGVGLARAVGHLRSAGSDGDNVGGAGRAVVNSFTCGDSGGHDGSGDNGETHLDNIDYWGVGGGLGL